MAATITKPKPKKAAATSKQQSPYKRLHVIIPIEDMLWASQQKPSVTQLWQECWTADPYGSRWMPLSTEMGYSTFIFAKKILSESGLFIFKPDKSIQDGRETASWMVKNLHGSRMKEFWEKANGENQQSDSLKQEPSAEKREPNSEDSEIDAGSEEIDALYKASILGQSQSEQEFQETSRTAQKHLTNSTKEFVRCASDTLTGNSRVEETAIAPLGVASPQSIQSVSEKEKDLPTAMDCTTLTLVDEVWGESASLLVENQDCGVELKDCHEGACSAAPIAQSEKYLNSAIAHQRPELVEQGYSASLSGENQVSGFEPRDCHEDTCSAAPVAQNEKYLNSAIANQTQGQVEKQGYSASLLLENSVSGVEMKVDHKGTGSAAPIAQNEFSSSLAIANQTQEEVEQSNPTPLMVENSVSGVEIKADNEGKGSAALVPDREKWSHEAIVARSNVRPGHMQKLKLAANSGENLGFDFLLSCWNDDPALQIVIKKLLAKFPQWGIAIVDGVLVDWDK